MIDHPMPMQSCRMALIVLLVLAAAPALADDAAKDTTAKAEGSPARLENRIETDDSDDSKSEAKSSDAKEDADGLEGMSVTHHTATIGGERIEYTATAGTLPLKNSEGKTIADVFFVAYTRDGIDEPERRPLTFCFNGGPGSSSVWLHMGMLGPMRVKLPDDAQPTRPPGELVPNTHSLLDVTDLVFIDPVSTGYSRPAKGEKKEQFHGYQEDLNSVGEFVHLYLTKYGRWLSPKFLCGESYGTLRAAALSGHLQDRYYLEFNGIVLISSVLDFQTLRFDGSNDLPYIVFLPSYAAAAWYHKRLPDELQRMPLEKFLAEVEKFTLDEYAPGLMKGTGLSKKERRELARRYARYTGLSAKFVMQSNLRVPMWRFAKELMREDDRTVGRFDSRYVGIDREAAGDSTDYDPSAAAVFGPYTSAVYHYFRNELDVRRDEPYEILTGKVQPWSYKPFENRYVDVSETLREAMTKNPFLRVFVANGYYDLATPYFGTEHTFRHLMLDETLRDHVQMEYFRGGHMMYVHEPSLKKLKADLVKFYEAALPDGDE
jgi:carboxypeptidase C (cathepsin A)